MIAFDPDIQKTILTSTKTLKEHGENHGQPVHDRGDGMKWHIPDVPAAAASFPGLALGSP